eukprot:1159068-Pelagomonas_calceolata.AAC.5
MTSGKKQLQAGKHACMQPFTSAMVACTRPAPSKGDEEMEYRRGCNARSAPRSCRATNMRIAYA